MYGDGNVYRGQQSKDSSVSITMDRDDFKALSELAVVGFKE